MQVVQEQLDHDLGKLLIQAIVDAEKDHFPDDAEKEHVLFAWQTATASYKLTRQLKPLDELVRHLSPRERQIVQLIMLGRSNKGIAHILEISPNTVSTYVRRIFAKLDVCSRAEMVSCVLRDNLLQHHLDWSDNAFFRPRS